MLPFLPLFAVHTGAWPVSEVWRKGFLEGFWFAASRKMRSPYVPDNSESSRISANFFSNNPIDLLGGEARPDKTRVPLSLLASKKSIDRWVSEIPLRAIAQIGKIVIGRTWHGELLLTLN